ncbi:MAG: AAA-like domain-containing protein, partial [Lachnospiraceae bacterium]|nr:AAA-like domain-containing protein [Lachnospiraceae bacterium]
MKKFNTAAVCIPSKHYMVNISDKVEMIKQMVDEGDYFTINRARQYGKTTTLNELRKALEEEYTVLDLSFEGISHAGFKDEQSFVKAFCSLLEEDFLLYQEIPEGTKIQLEDYIGRKEEKADMRELFRTLGEWCTISDRPIVLLVDEVDSATNNQVFLDFLGLLRKGYINRESRGIPTFQSVILAGVTDVKHLKSKIRDEADAKQNSPWNIAADFTVDMSLSEYGIRGMLDEYEADHQTGMDTSSIAKQIRGYTNGYTFLVSLICQIIDQRMLPESFANLAESWTEYGVDEAVRLLLSEDNTLFASLMGKLHNMPTLRSQLRKILMSGEVVIWQTYDKEQELLRMYGFIRNNKGTVAVENRIFEMLLYHHFIGENHENDDLKRLAVLDRPAFITEDGFLDMPKIMERFIEEHNRIHKNKSEKFLEEEGRERFITYVSPIINGTGTYSVEEQLRDYRRTDLVIHYLGRRYVIELKIWHGDRYNAQGERQILDYLDYWNLST